MGLTNILQTARNSLAIQSQQTDYSQVNIYSPVSHKAQQFHDSHAKIRLLDGGNQSGKTTATTYEFLTIARGLPHGCQGLALTNTYRDIGKNLWPHIKQWLSPHWYKWGGGNRIADNPTLIILKHNGFRMYFGSYEQEREAHQGAIWDLVLFDEEAPKYIYEEVFRGTLAHHAPIVYGVTPLKGITYVTEEIRAKGIDPGYPDYWALSEPMSLLENPYIPQSEKDMWVDMLSEKSRQSRVFGFATSQEGLVYDEFSQATHVCDPFPIPDTWRFYRGIDFGYEHPTTSIIMATDGFRIFVIDEYYQSHRLAEEHVKAIREQERRVVLESGTNLLPYFETISDHDKQLRMEYEAQGAAQGLYSSPAQKEVIAGIEVVRNLLAIRGDGQPRLKVFRHCPHTIKEFQLYHYSGEDRKGKLKAGEKADAPVKEFDHCLDPIRYCIVEEFGFVRDEINKIISVR